MNATQTGQYEVTLDTTDDEGYPWMVLDSEGDVYDAFATEAEAKEEASSKNRESEIEATRDQVVDLLYAMETSPADLEKIRAIKAILES